MMRPQEAVGIATSTVATVAVGVRLFTRLHIAKRALLTGEWLNIVGLATVWIMVGFTFPYDYWFEQVVNSQTEQELAFNTNKFNIYNAVTGLSFLATLCVAKLSILAFYLRLSPQRGFRTAVRALMALVVSYTVVCAVVSLLIFSPDPAISQNVKEHDNVLSLFYGVCNIIIDVFILLLPVHIVLPLQMSVRRKISVLVLFGAGGFVCAAAIWRAMSITYVTKQQTSYASLAKSLILSFTEANGAVVCACVPVSSKFFTQFLPGFVSTVVSRSRRGSADSGATDGSGGAWPSYYNLRYSSSVEENRRRRAEMRETKSIEEVYKESQRSPSAVSAVSDDSASEQRVSHNV